MINQRSANAAPCVLGSAESLPFIDGSFDACMSALSLHHWANLRAGLQEMRRVTQKRIVLFTFLPDAGEKFWLTQDYFPEFAQEDARIFPSLETLSEHLDLPLRSEVVPIPHDLQDGFQGAYWRRPQAYLEEATRACISSFARRERAALQPGLLRLRQDLLSGDWTKKHGECLTKHTMDLGYRMVIAELP